MAQSTGRLAMPEELLRVPPTLLDIPGWNPRGRKVVRRGVRASVRLTKTIFMPIAVKRAGDGRFRVLVGRGAGTAQTAAELQLRDVPIAVYPDSVDDLKFFIHEGLTSMKVSQNHLAQALAGSIKNGMGDERLNAYIREAKALKPGLVRYIEQALKLLGRDGFKEWFLEFNEGKGLGVHPITVALEYAEARNDVAGDTIMTKHDTRELAEWIARHHATRRVRNYIQLGLLSEVEKFFRADKPLPWDVSLQEKLLSLMKTKTGKSAK